MIRRAYDWFGKKVHSPYALVWLIGFFFLEASVFFIPVDPLLILFCIENSKRSFWYATVATLASVIGGMFGYLIGSVMWDSIGSTIVRWLISEHTFSNVVQKYSLYQAWAVFIAGFTPVPYKAVTISAGFCKLPFVPFVWYSLLARASRFFLVSGAIYLWGEKIKVIIDEYFNYLVVAFTILLIFFCSVLKGANMIELGMPQIKKIEAIARSKKNCISFAQGTMRFGGVHQHIKEYARQILLTDKADYYQDPLGLFSLRQKIAGKLSKEHNISLDVDNIMVSHGAIGALTAFCLTYLQHGDEVIIPEPAYPAYENIASFCKAKSVFVPAFSMQANAQGQYYWKFDLDKIQEAFSSKTKMIIISNPSNPCGTYLSKDEILQLKRFCDSKKIYLVFDEIYDDFIFEGEFFSSMPLVVESEYIIRIGSFSKNFGMSGWRVGFLVATAPVIEALAPVQACFLNCPTVISQYAVLYALEHKKEILADYNEKLKKSREIVCSFFDRMQEQGIFTYVRPTSGFYLFFKTREADSFNLVMDILDKANIAMAPGNDFGQHCAPFIRFCFAREPEVITEGIKRLQDYFFLKRRSRSMEMMSSTL